MNASGVMKSGGAIQSLHTQQLEPKLASQGVSTALWIRMVLYWNRSEITSPDGAGPGIQCNGVTPAGGSDAQDNYRRGDQR